MRIKPLKASGGATSWTRELIVKMYKRSDGKSENYYVRVVIPKEFHAHFNQDRFIASTKTSNKKLARARAAQIVARWEKQLYDAALAKVDSGRFDATEPRPALLTDDLIQMLCTTRLGSVVEDDRAERLQGLSEEQVAETDAFLGKLVAQLQAVLIRGKGASAEYRAVEEDALEWADTQGYVIERDDPLLPAYVAAFARAEKRAVDLLVKRQHGDEAPSGIEEVGDSLKDILEEWKEEKARSLDPKTVASHATRFLQFAEFVQHIPAQMVKKRHIHDWYRYVLFKLGKAPKTLQDGYIPAVRAVFALAASNGSIAENPTLGVSIPKLDKTEARERQEPRHPFSVKQLNELFASAWYAPSGALSGVTPFHKGGGAAYWMPLISLFHNFRLAEICQLLVANVFEVNGILALEITDEGTLKLGADPKNRANQKRLKNDSTRRGIPMHASVVTLGFAQYVEGVRAQGAKRLFPELDKYAGDGSTAFGKVFNRFVREGLKLPAGYVFHSFRHTWEDALRAAIEKASRTGYQWPKGMHFAISGRAGAMPGTRPSDSEVEDEGSAKDYGLGYSVVAKKPYVDQIDYPGLRVPPAWAAFQMR